MSETGEGDEEVQLPVKMNGIIMDEITSTGSIKNIIITLNGDRW